MISDESDNILNLITKNNIINYIVNGLLEKVTTLSVIPSVGIEVKTKVLTDVFEIVSFTLFKTTASIYLRCGNINSLLVLSQAIYFGKLVFSDNLR